MLEEVPEGSLWPHWKLRQQCFDTAGTKLATKPSFPVFHILPSCLDSLLGEPFLGLLADQSPQILQCPVRLVARFLPVDLVIDRDPHLSHKTCKGRQRSDIGGGFGVLVGAQASRLWSIGFGNPACFGMDQEQRRCVRHLYLWHYHCLLNRVHLGRNCCSDCRGDLLHSHFRSLALLIKADGGIYLYRSLLCLDIKRLVVHREADPHQEELLRLEVAAVLFQI